MKNILFTILSNSVENQKIKMIEYLSQSEINGLYYVSTVNDLGYFCIVRPDYSTDEASTNLLISEKLSKKSPNTIKKTASSVCKFLNYLLLFEIKLDEFDRLDKLLLGFSVFLQIFNSKSFSNKKSIEWSLINEVPLISDNLKILESNMYGKTNINDYTNLSPQTINATVKNAIKFLIFYNNNYEKLNLNSIPRKNKYQKSNFSSTDTTMYSTEVFDTNYILYNVGIESSSKKRVEAITERIPNKSEIDLIEQYTRNNKNPTSYFLIMCLKGFGIRAGELSNIKFNDNILPSNFLSLHLDEAISVMKNTLNLCDIHFHPNLNTWVCEIFDNDSEDIYTRNKSRSRIIPYIFEQEEFSKQLYLVIRYRLLNKRYNPKIELPVFLFINYKYGNKRFKNYSVKNVVNHICLKSTLKYSYDLNWIHPHSFRHFFATYLLRERNYTIDDISRMLGHSDTETTRNTYIHYLQNNETSNLINNLKDTFKEGVDTH